MPKHATYKDKIAMLQEWMPHVIEVVKKDLKSEHLKGDMGFVRNYFPGKNPAKLSAEEMASAYVEAIASMENSEDLAEFIANRWLLKNADLYHHFEQELTKIDPNFNELDAIDAATASKILDEAVAQYGPVNTYLFCIFNSVVFPEETLTSLNQKAKGHHMSKAAQEELQKEERSLEAIKRNCDQQIARLTDKYEKKVLGLQKKYVQDVDSLKKQVAALQRKLAQHDS